MVNRKKQNIPLNPLGKYYFRESLLMNHERDNVYSIFFFFLIYISISFDILCKYMLRYIKIKGKMKTFSVSLCSKVVSWSPSAAQ